MQVGFGHFFGKSLFLHLHFRWFLSSEQGGVHAAIINCGFLVHLVSGPAIQSLIYGQQYKFPLH